MSATDTNAEVIDGTAVEIYRQPPTTPSTLFHTDDPVEVIEKATRVADALKKVVASRGLIARIGGKEHPQVEAWQTLGSMVGVFPVRPRIRQEQWPNPVPDALKRQHDKGLAFGFTASFDAQRADGAVVGGAEASCMRTEKRWADADDYAVKSMAQTRATSKTLATPLRFIMTLAGYEGTPAEEMPSDGYQGRQAPQTTAQPAQPSERAASGPQKGAINARMAAGSVKEDDAKAILQWSAGTAVVDRVSKAAASKLIDRLKQDGSGAQEILDEISTEAERGDERARTIVSRYFEVTPHA